MAIRAKSAGTEGNRRSGSSETRKRFSVKSNLYFITLVLFFTLLLVKVVLSGIFLGTSPLNITSPDTAMAQEVAVEEEQDLDALEMRLKKKEKELEEKEAELNKMEEQLMPLKKEIDARMEELNDLQNTLNAYAANLAKREKALNDTKIDNLVKMYSAMEAGKAARLLEKQDTDTVVRILGNMKGKNAGQILAAMDIEKGATISEKLSESK